MDYFAHPRPLSPNLITWPFFIDFDSRRALILDDGNQLIALTRILDVSEILALALDDPNPWPPVGGMRGTTVTLNELLALGKELRGGEWQIEYIRSEDIRKGELKSSWIPPLAHPVIPVEHRKQFSRDFVIMFMDAILRGSWVTSDEWNKRFPDYKFTSAREYLTEAWNRYKG